MNFEIRSLLTMGLKIDICLSIDEFLQFKEKVLIQTIYNVMNGLAVKFYVVFLRQKLKYCVDKLNEKVYNYNVLV